MTRLQARETAREILRIVPLVMRAVAAELRAAGELPAPAHFGLLSVLCAQARTVSELAALQGVSLPTMSNSITAMVDRGWVRRMARSGDRRVLTIEVTPAGRAAVERVGRAAETHLADVLDPLDGTSRRRLQAGLAVLSKVFGDVSGRPSGRPCSRPGRGRETPKPAAGRLAGTRTSPLVSASNRGRRRRERTDHLETS
jgi:DNA-binding MarR family transcriptional regulator